MLSQWGGGNVRRLTQQSISTQLRLTQMTIWGPARGMGDGGPMSPVWFLKRLVSVFIDACRLLSALPSLSQFGWGRLSLVAISFYALSLLFGLCRLSEFTLAGPHNLVRLILRKFELWPISLKGLSYKTDSSPKQTTRVGIWLRHFFPTTCLYQIDLYCFRSLCLLVEHPALSS